MDPQLYRATTEGDILKFVRAMEHATHGRPHHPSAACLQLGPQKTTVLHISTSHAHHEIVKLVCKDLPDLVTEKNARGDTAAHIAARSGDSLLVTLLINADSARDPLGEKNDEGNTPLHEALICEHEEVARMLISKNRSMSYSTNNRGESLLYLAAKAGLVTIVRMLLDNPAGKCTGPAKDAENSPVYAAILRRDTDVLSLLLEKDPSLFKLKMEKGENPLHVAAREGYSEGVKVLLYKHNEFSYEKDEHGYNPIHTAAEEGLIDVVETMLKQCLDMRELLTAKGRNIMHVAARSARSKLVEYMLGVPELDCLVNEKDEEGNTPLHLATIYGHSRVVGVLVGDEKVNVNQVNENLQTALDVAEEFVDAGFAPFQKMLTLMALRAVDAPRANQALARRITATGGTADTESRRDKVNAILIVATVIATVTFQAGFSVPGGYSASFPDPGTASMVEKAKFQEFVICDAVAMYSSVAVGVLLLWAQLGDPRATGFAMRAALPLLGLSLTAMSIAFMAGVYLAVSRLAWLANVVLVVGSSFTVALAVLFLPMCFLGSSKYRAFRRVSYYPFWLALYLFGA